MISFNHVPEQVSHFYKWELNSAQFIIIPATESSSEASSLLDKEALIACVKIAADPRLADKLKLHLLISGCYFLLLNLIKLLLL